MAGEAPGDWSLVPDLSPAALEEIAPGLTLTLLARELCEPPMDPSQLLRLRRRERWPSATTIWRIERALERARMSAAGGWVPPPVRRGPAPKISPAPSGTVAGKVKR